MVLFILDDKADPTDIRNSYSMEVAIEDLKNIIDCQNLVIDTFKKGFNGL